MSRWRVAACGWWLVAAGCGRYADFTLPQSLGTPAEVRFHFQMRPEPVLGRGPQGTFDAVDALNPSVVRRDGLLYNFYSGFDGSTWHTGLATSSDGVAWDKLGKVLSPDPRTWEGGYIAANGSALVVNDQFFYWYQAGRPPSIGLATSANGRQWRKRPRPVLTPGPRGSFDEGGVADPYVLRAGEHYYMFYLGQDRARRQRLGVARSSDGIVWAKLRSNPVLELGAPGAFDENGLGEPAVWASHGRYWMLYTGRDRAENRRLGLARSRDGVHWERVSESPVLAGNAAWNSRVICDPSVDAGSAPPWRVWFGGGDVARPDERLNGQIGLATIQPAPVTLER